MKKQIFFFIALATLVLISMVIGRNVSFSSKVANVFNNKDESIKKVFTRVSIEKEAKQLAEKGDFDKAIELYEKAIEPQYVDYKHQMGTAMGAMREIYKMRGQYEKALEIMNWFLNGNPNPEMALLEKSEIEALMNYRNTNSPREIYAHIDLLKEKNRKWLPPSGYGVGAGIIISDILRLYDTIGDYDAGIAYIDEILAYFRTGKAGDPKPGKVDAEYMKIREAFEKDKAAGTKGSATKALIQSDYFPW